MCTAVSEAGLTDTGVSWEIGGAMGVARTLARASTPPSRFQYCFRSLSNPPIIIYACTFARAHLITMWPIEDLVRPEDQPFEVELTKNPNSVEAWLKYARFKRESSFENRVFVIERAVRQFPKNREMWNLYLQTCQEGLHDPHTTISTSQITRVHRRLLSQFKNESEWWLKYLSFLVNYQPHEITLIRQAFNECLYELPLSSHRSVWPLILEYADTVGGATAANMYCKFLGFASLEDVAAGSEFPSQPSIETIILKLVAFGDAGTATDLLLEVLASMLLSSALLSSPFHFVIDFCETLEKFAEEKSDSLIEKVAQAALPKFKDQAGKLFCQLAQYYIARHNTEKARHNFKTGIQECVTTEDFALLYDSYTLFEEQLLEEWSGEELEKQMDAYETLLEQRPVLLNDVILRQDVNNIDTWFERVAIFSQRDDTNSVLTTYATALSQINPLKSYSLLPSSGYTLPQLWADYAQVYWNHKDHSTADFIFAKAVKTQFKSPDDLAQIYIEWAKLWMEEDCDKAVAILQTALDKKMVDPETIDYRDSSVPVGDRIIKSIKLWSFYLDLLESNLDSDEAENNKDAIKLVEDSYKRVIELRIATPLTIVNFAAFYEDLKFFERSYTVYETGLKVFRDSRVRFEIWNVYLSKLYQRKVGKERLRELFKTAIYGGNSQDCGCPADLCKSLVLLYSQFEHENGMDLMSVKALRDGIDKITVALESKETTEKKGMAADLVDDKAAIYSVLLIRVEEIADKSLCRQTYEECLQDKQLRLSHIIKFTRRFILYETQLGEVSRARALLRYVCNLGHPEMALLATVWEEWEQFELKHGNETTFKDMLQFRRATRENFEKDELFKLSLNPMDFVKSSKKRPHMEANPDSIEIDMDM